MPKRSLPRNSKFEQLDQAVTQLLAGPVIAVQSLDPELMPLLLVAAELRSLPREDFKTRLKSDLKRRASMANTTEAVAAVEQTAVEQTKEEKKPDVDPIPKGYSTVTPYIVAQDADALIDFMKKTFDAEELFRSGPGSEGGLHCEIRLGDSMLMVGGGGAGMKWRGTPMPSAFHVYVPDCDATYARALEAGAASINKPADQFYGERSATVKDAAENFWYIATYKGESYKWPGAPTVQTSLHPLRAEPVINFVKRAFGAVELGRHATPDGVIRHATVKIGTGLIELGEAHGPYQPRPTMFYLYVPDVDALYHRAIEAGGTSISEPADQPYGDRSGGVTDPFGNKWYIATHIKDM